MAGSSLACQAGNSPPVAVGQRHAFCTGTTRPLLPHHPRLLARRVASVTVARATVSTRAPRRTGSRKSGGSAKSASQQKYLLATGFPFPLGPVLERPTRRYEVERGRIWMFEQEQGLGGSNVTVNVRMTVIKLAEGSLWVHSPIAPTRECIRLLKELNAPVEFIVLSTFAYEHKVFVGPFSRAFPKAKVYVAPRQWSWPISLPVQFFGIFPAGVLRTGDGTVPWAAEIEQKVFTGNVGIGPYTEVAFFHKASRTLLLTDAVIYIPDRAPDVVRPDKLLDAGSDNFFVKVLGALKKDQPAGAPVQAQQRSTVRGGTMPVRAKPQGAQVARQQRRTVRSPTRTALQLKRQQSPGSSRAGKLSAAEQMRLGWQRMVLQVLYFVPGNLADPRAGFNAVAKRLIVSPVVKTLVFSKVPSEARNWVDSICADWKFTRIIPAHLAAPIPAGPQDLRAAFHFIYNSAPARGRAATAPGFSLATALAQLFGKRTPTMAQFPEEDMAALRGLDSFLKKTGVAAEPAD